MVGEGDRLRVTFPLAFPENVRGDLYEDADRIDRFEGDGDLDEVFALVFSSVLVVAWTVGFRIPLGYLVASTVRDLDCTGRFQYVWAPNPFVVLLVVLVVFEVFIWQLYIL